MAIGYSYTFVATSHMTPLTLERSVHSAVEVYCLLSASAVDRLDSPSIRVSCSSIVEEPLEMGSVSGCHFLR